MLAYRIQSDAAFDLLKWRSQETNIKLRVLAEQLIAEGTVPCSGSSSQRGSPL